jgi:hypothetical protein
MPYKDSEYKTLDEDLGKQTQRFLGRVQDNGIAGDCWKTAIACLLHIPRETVPHFLQLEQVIPDYNWWDETVKFVQAKVPGWTLVSLVDTTFPIYTNPESGPQRVILSGQSPRGDFLHAVIADAVTGEMLWDPHPSRAGILTLEEVSVLTYLDEEKR